MRSVRSKSTLTAFAVALTALAILCPRPAAALDLPNFMKIGRWFGLSENARDEIREEERVSEVLNQDASYRSLFSEINNPDVKLRNFVRPGEEMRYQAKWRGLPAGTVRLAAKRVATLKDRPVFVFEVSVESNDFLGAFYPVQTRLNSYADANNGRSYLLRRIVAERSRSYKDRLEFKYDYRMANGLPDPVSKYSVTGPSGKEEASLPFPIPGNMQDVVSVIYYLRGLELNEVGDSCSLLLGGRKKPVLTQIKVVGEEDVAVPELGSFSCLVLEAQTDGTNISGSLFATRGGEKIWVEKNSRIPLMVSADFANPIGTVVATLTHAENTLLGKPAKQ